MRVFLTGGTGFIGGHVARQLRERGDDVVALVRSPAKADALEALGCEVVAGDLSDLEAIHRGLDGAGAAIHGAAMYEVGIPASQRQPMREANVVGTENVLGACLAAGTPKVVYVSTIAAFGNTNGEIVDESYEHPAREFTSCYEQTKYEAHQIARRLIAEGLPCVIVQPGGVYGPRDHSVLGQQMKQFLAGRMPFLVFPDTGFNMVHVEDAAGGVLLALDRGQPGESYVLGAEITTMRGLIETLARVADRRPPRITIPTRLLRLSTPAGPLIGKVMGQPPNLRELISSADGVTFWARDDKARSELGYSSRGLEEGLRETLVAEGQPAGDATTAA
jgi:nucleoside-diphosphate-sugar epimerase